MPPISSKYRTGQPMLSLNIGGVEFTADMYRFVNVVTVTHERGKPTTCSIEFHDPVIEMSGNEIFNYGNPVHIVCGWEFEPVRKGPFKIINHKAYLPEVGAPTFTIECIDRSVASMHIQAKSRSWTGSRPSDIVAEHARVYGLIAAIDILVEEDIPFTDDFSLIQAGVTDATIMQTLALKMGYIWGVHGNTLYFQRPEKVRDKPILLEYRTGKKSIKKFSPELKGFGAGGKKKGVATGASAEVMLEGPRYEVLESMEDTFIASENYTLLEDLTQYREEPGGRFKWGVYVAETPPIGNSEDGATVIGKVFSTIGSAAEGIQSGKYAEKLESVQDVLQGKRPRNAVAKDQVVGPLRKQETFRDVNWVNGYETSYSGYSEQFEREQPVDLVRGDEGQALPDDPDRMKMHIAKTMRGRIVPISCKFTPTIPSWEWTALDSVEIRGVGKRYEGMYEITKVVLEYSTTKALSTEISARKRSAGSKKQPKGAEGTEGVAGASDDPNNPRNPMEKAIGEMHDGFKRILQGSTGAEKANAPVTEALDFKYGAGRNQKGPL